MSSGEHKVEFFFKPVTPAWLTAARIEGICSEGRGADWMKGTVEADILKQ